MRRKSFAEMNCSVAHALEIVGEWWTMLIIRDCFLGVTRFDDFQGRLGISRNVLTERLDRLVDNDVVVRVPYQQRPVRHDYRLTEKGRDLWLILTALRQWGDRWESPEGAPVLLDHRACDQATTVVPVCSSCGELLDARAVRVRPGPGAVKQPADGLASPEANAPTGRLVT